MLIIDEKSNGGLAPNLAGWSLLPESEHHLHHGLKGINIAISAVTADVLSRTIPAGMFSRSSEAHNQDKVSMGMNAAVQCMELVESVTSIYAMQFTALTQAIDLRKIRLSGAVSRALYSLVRAVMPMLVIDRSLSEDLAKLLYRFKRYIDANRQGRSEEEPAQTLDECDAG
jgi:histidine ammonia-lyase/phenylalanine ammonia-lyase